MSKHTFEDDGYRVYARRDGKMLGVVTEYKNSEFGYLFDEYKKQLKNTCSHTCSHGCGNDEKLYTKEEMLDFFKYGMTFIISRIDRDPAVSILEVMEKLHDELDEELKNLKQ